MNVVKYRHRNSTPGTASNMVTIPQEIANLIPDDVVAFKVMLTDDGILYQPLTEEGQSNDLPDWMKR